MRNRNSIYRKVTIIKPKMLYPNILVYGEIIGRYNYSK